MRDGDLGEDKELALAMSSRECPVDPPWRCVGSRLYKSEVVGRCPARDRNVGAMVS